MTSPAYGIVLLALHVISLVAGIMGNGFILIVNFIGWIRNSHDVSSSDLIVSSLVLTNLGQIGVFFAMNNWFTLSETYFPQMFGVKGYFVSLLFLHCSNLWCVTWFCSYCCMKIVTFTHPFLIRLMTVFMEKVPWLLLGSVLLSLATCLPEAFDSRIQLQGNILSNFSNNSTFIVTVNGTITGYKSWRIPRVHNIPYMVHMQLVMAIFLVSTVAILITLFRHMNRMGQNAENFRSPHQEAHWGAVKTVASLLILYASFYVGQNIKRFIYESPESPWHCAWVLWLLYFPTLTFILLILRISSLKKALVGLFSPAACGGRGGA